MIYVHIDQPTAVTVMLLSAKCSPSEARKLCTSDAMSAPGCAGVSLNSVKKTGEAPTRRAMTDVSTAISTTRCREKRIIRKLYVLNLRFIKDQTEHWRVHNTPSAHAMWVDYVTIFAVYLLSTAYVVTMAVLSRGFQLTVQN